jgi:hypothetical protein
MRAPHPVSAGSRGGQAVIEFVIGLVAILTLLAGLFQLASLIRTHTDTMIEARRQAALLAAQDLGPGVVPVSDAEYIRDWQAGGDAKPYTRDDDSTPASAASFNSVILDKAVPDDAAWTVMGQAPNNRFSGIHNLPNPSTYFGLFKGSDARTVDLLPAARHLFYDADSIEVRCDVWMTWTKGLY